jgi:hypothetical protein
MNFRCYEGFSASPAGPSGEFNPDRGHDPGWLCSSVVSNQLPPLATPPEVAEYLHTTTASLAQDRYKGTGPKVHQAGEPGSVSLVGCLGVAGSQHDSAHCRPTGTMTVVVAITSAGSYYDQPGPSPWLCGPSAAVLIVGCGERGPMSWAMPSVPTPSLRLWLVRTSSVQLTFL